ncbi:MAG: DUF2283 domain-containing protein [Acidobacteria bacterium]|nr:DUF2283 domain-containing protein [Acidobacteriota bacterium]
MKLRYDEDEEALYILLTEGEEISRTEQVDPGTLVDLDRRGRVIGIEVLQPARVWPLEEIITRFPITQPDEALLRDLWDRQGRPFPFAKPTRIAV